MTRKRLTAPLLTDGINVYNSYGFKELRSIGSLRIVLMELECYKVDEIMILDISERIGLKFAKHKFLQTIDKCNLNTPLSFGGNLSEIDYAKELIFSGIERLVIGPSSLLTSNIVMSISEVFGESSLVINLPVSGYSAKHQKFLILVNGNEISISESDLKIPINYSGEICLMDTNAEGKNCHHDLTFVRRLSSRYLNSKFILYGGFGFHLLKKYLVNDYISAIAIDNGLSFTEMPRNRFVKKSTKFRDV